MIKRTFYTLSWLTLTPKVFPWLGSPHWDWDLNWQWQDDQMTCHFIMNNLETRFNLLSKFTIYWFVRWMIDIFLSIINLCNSQFFFFFFFFFRSVIITQIVKLSVKIVMFTLALIDQSINPTPPPLYAA